MKISALICTALFATASAFAPSTVERTSTALNMDRRAAFGQIGAAAAVMAGLPSVASADGAVSAATITKAKIVYGSRIAALKDAVEKGDFKAVAAEKSAFILFNSGAYPTAKDKSKKAAAIEGVNAIFSAIRSGDKAALKSAYSAYVAANGIKPLPKVDGATSQSYSSDYSYLVKTPAAAVYVR
jgi:hypothetical protein